MKLSGLLLIALLAAHIANAGVVKARGAAKRKHYTEPSQMDIDDVIRAEEDPNFLQYLKDREREHKLDEAAALENRRQRRAEEAAHEKARIQYVIENQRAAPDEARQEEIYTKEQMAWEQQQERYRQQYVMDHHKREERLKIERMARIQKAFSPQRMPASDK